MSAAGPAGTSGTWAVVTGASDGIGAAVARRLAARGDDLVLVARRQDRLEEVARAAAAHGVRTLVVAADLAEPAGVRRVLEETAGLDVGLLVAAAGFGSGGDLVDADVETEASMLRVNCEAVVRLCHGFGSRFVARGGGDIVLLSSIVAFQGVPGQATYSATKAFVQAFAEALGRELRPRGVRVLSVAPGPVRSGFGERAGLDLTAGAPPDDVARALVSRLGRPGTLFPGRLSKVLRAALAGLPRGLRTTVLGRVVAGMRA
ncbi:MAG: SDR family NAD(P)-dependent oxidoreductase [Actinobacteria bacterium]|nr:SDR family NAD(P)-dependent oxidoreductase [Actinomycetota bacterium]